MTWDKTPLSNIVMLLIQWGLSQSHVFQDNRTKRPTLERVQMEFTINKVLILKTSKILKYLENNIATGEILSHPSLDVGRSVTFLSTFISPINRPCFSVSCRTGGTSAN
jgi:hypothetical protein